MSTEEIRQMLNISLIIALVLILVLGFVAILKWEGKNSLKIAKYQ